MRFYGRFSLANQKPRKAIDNVRVILNKIHLSLISASLRRLFPLFDHFGVLLLTARPWAERGSRFTRGLLSFFFFVGDQTQTSARPNFESRNV